eukprot:366234-Chlamydomonas_euryale.AAC.3
MHGRRRLLGRAHLEHQRHQQQLLADAAASQEFHVDARVRVLEAHIVTRAVRTFCPFCCLVGRGRVRCQGISSILFPGRPWPCARSGHFVHFGPRPVLDRPWPCAPSGHFVCFGHGHAHGHGILPVSFFDRPWPCARHGHAHVHGILPVSFLSRPRPCAWSGQATDMCVVRAQQCVWRGRGHVHGQSTAMCVARARTCAWSEHSQVCGEGAGRCGRASAHPGSSHMRGVAWTVIRSSISMSAHGHLCGP